MQIILFYMLTLLAAVFATQDLVIKYQWKQIDFEFDNEEHRSQALSAGLFIQQNIIPYGIEIFNDILYVTLPRWKDGVPASLAFIDLKDTSPIGPPLKPYPNWEAHDMKQIEPLIISPMRVRADHCGRLWVLDTRTTNIFDTPRTYGPTQLIIFDLHTHKFIQKIIFPSSHQKHSLYASLDIEDTDCLNTYAYAGDMMNPYLMVYSLKTGDFWRIENEGFQPERVAGHQLIKDMNLQWNEGLYDVTVVHTLNETSLYYHSLSSLMEHKVSTEFLHNKSEALSKNNEYAFKIIGTRPPKGEAGASVFHKHTGLIFLTFPNMHGFGVVSPDSEIYECSVMFSNRDLMPFPSDIAIDENNSLWVLSSDLHAYMHDELAENDINFRVLATSIPTDDPYNTLRLLSVVTWKDEIGMAESGGSKNNYNCIILSLLYTIYVKILQ